MPNRPLHSCNTGGCSNAAPAGERYCDFCRPRVPKEIRTPNDPRYNTTAWRDLSKIFRHINHTCQLLDDTGTQCRNESEIVHHLKSPQEAPHLFRDWNNLVALCKEHHGHTRGETQDRRFCHTIGTCNAIYSHGWLLPNWHKDYVPQTLAIQVGGTRSAVGADAIRRALEEPI
jgi:hypothetical protein